MAKSMTAYGRVTGATDTKMITVEVKSVNSRYLDPQIKTSKGYSYLEVYAKPLLQSYISRGKVDMYIGIESFSDDSSHIILDKSYTAKYIAALRELRDTFSLTDDISVMSVAQNRDLFKNIGGEDADSVWSEVKPFVINALDSFNEMRTREGENISQDLLAKKDYISKMTDSITENSEKCTYSFRSKFENRLRKILADADAALDEQRILTECAIYADKISVDEEIVRLKSHIKAFEEIFDKDEPIGRKLDFLLQEMNRETNTIGSKCSDAEISRTVVDIKCELEKIREQVQNLE